VLSTRDELCACVPLPFDHPTLFLFAIYQDLSGQLIFRRMSSRSWMRVS